MIRLKYPWLVFTLLGCALVATAEAQSFASVSVAKEPLVTNPRLKPPPPPPKLKMAAVAAVPPRLESPAVRSVAVVDPTVLPVAPALLQALYTEARVGLARTDTMVRAMDILNDIARAGYSAAGQLLALLGAVVPSAKANDVGPFVAGAPKTVTAPLSPSIDYGAQTNVNTDPNPVYSIATSIQDPAFSTAQLVEPFEGAPDENF